MKCPQDVKTYTYDRRRYLFDVIIPAVIAALGVVVDLVFLFLGIPPIITLVLGIVCLYVLINTFVAHAYPRTVSLCDGIMRLESFGCVHEWDLSELKHISVREDRKSLSMYVRLGGATLLKGRYFLGCGDMRDDGGESASALYQLILDTEERLNPNGLRVRARKQQVSVPAKRGGKHK